MATGVKLTESLNQRPGKKTITDMQTALRNLGPYSHATDSNSEEVLTYIGKQILDNVLQIMVTQGVSLCANLLRYFYEKLTNAVVCEDVDLHSEDGELHIVLVSNGSISDQTHPANRLVPQNTITDTILYAPWNCAIDAEVAYGVSTGSILPEHRVFINGEPQGPLPERWNSMAAQQTTDVPEIILNPMENEDEWDIASADVDTLYQNHNRLVIPYPPRGDLAEFLPPVPLHEIVAMIASLLEFLPPHRATIHLAAGLEYRGAQPPNEEMWQNQYVHTSDGTVMSMRNMEFRGLYDALHLLFNQNGN